MIKWGIIGTGTMASTFVQAIQRNKNCSVEAVGSRTLTNASKFAERFGITHSFGSYEELSQCADIEVVYIASTNNFHYKNALQALNAGKHILIEKPFALNHKESKEILDLAQSKGLFCMEGMWMRFIPMIQKAKELVDNGEIGSIQMLTANFGMPMQYDANNRQYDPKLGGGALLDLLVYPISLAHLILGKPKAIQSLSTLTPSGVDAQTTCMFSYESGTISNLQASFSTALANEVYLYGEKGSIHITAPIYRPHESHIKYFSTMSPTDLKSDEGGGISSTIKNNKLVRALLFKIGGLVKHVLQKKLIVPFEGSGYDHQVEEVVNCLKNKKKESSIMSHKDTLEVMQVLDIIRQQQNIKYIL